MLPLTTKAAQAFASSHLFFIIARMHTPHFFSYTRISLPTRSKCSVHTDYWISLLESTRGLDKIIRFSTYLGIDDVSSNIPCFLRLLFPILED